MYKAILFDLYGTLVDIRTDESRPDLWQKLAYHYAAQGARYCPNELEVAYLRLVDQAKSDLKTDVYPDMDLLDVFEQLYAQKNVHVDKGMVQQTATLFRLLSLDYIKCYEGVDQLMSFLKSIGLKLHLLSNAQACFTLDELKIVGLDQALDSIYLSSDYKIAKPDPRFFNVLLKDQGLNPSDCLFIGNDHRTDIAGANALGMDSIYIHTNCSAPTLPDRIECKWTIMSGEINELLDLLKSVL